MSHIERPLAGVDTLILAGGLGTRLRAALPDRPKLLAPIGDHVFLDYLLEWLASYGIDKVVLSLGHMADKIVDYLTANTPVGMQITPLIEPQPQGTAGAIRFSLSSLQSDPVMVMNGDSLVDADLGAFLASHRASDAAASLLCTRVEDGSSYGTVNVDDQGYIRSFQEKVAYKTGASLINAGIYMMDRPMLDAIEATPGPSLENDVFPTLAPHMLSSFAGEFDFIDIGTPESLELAKEYIRRHFENI